MQLVEWAVVGALTLLLLPGVNRAAAALSSLLKYLASAAAAALLALAIVAALSSTEAYRTVLGTQLDRTELSAQSAVRRAGDLWARGLEAYQRSQGAQGQR
jgi:hypothetical protein